MAKQVITHNYQCRHGHKPRQAPGAGAAEWVFQLDEDPTPVRIHETYYLAVNKALQQAKRTVTVLP